MSVRRLPALFLGLALLGLAACGPSADTSGLPTQFPLLEGDQDLWPTMSDAERQRAILFLTSGSTIQSSLLAD
ncbi:hypothetical protein PSA7680_02365 [Pseudoruegeria aquimaris]|uniref:Uncharacterized protein n=1 Tax=Pseudoruegeria aquimaris TaxID=393663 RepID=A0A1Y5SQQ4_9RHOB|nr:hypothetical protein [Pseudoruegeria aquimaris]SLN46230.1 hypothetical protein PSA7680_02365 [Pseudoruegeria aquimaris]